MSVKKTRSLDFTLISFPSDTLTIGACRKLFPVDFASDFPTFFNDEIRTAEINAMLDAERKFVRKVFAKASNQPDPYPESDDAKVQITSQLMDGYKRFGLSSGVQQSRLMLRQLEDAANTLAGRKMPTVGPRGT